MPGSHRLPKLLGHARPRRVISNYRDGLTCHAIERHDPCESPFGLSYQAATYERK